MEKPWDTVTKKTETILKLYQDLEVNSKSKELTWKKKTYLPKTEIGEKHIFYEIDSDKYFFSENEETACFVVLEKNGKSKFALFLKLNSTGKYQVKEVNLSSGDFWGSMSNN